ncbi:unnamed protein product [Cyclocybe aegerita]|uniref:Uncharacterized protein n=1 Tax=Cyclocybe aegerita TaxID=1973307 RepID=A0A8S0Y0D0_CYCAE|nr:unnamed protein product [Cyclocybe aegerita]
MTSLSLMCDEDDALIKEERWVCAGQIIDEDECNPSSRFLTLEGRNFLWDCNWSVEWYRKQTRLYDVTVSGFKETKAFKLTVDNLFSNLECLPNLRSLELQRLELTTSPKMDRHALELKLTLADLKAHAIVDIFRATNMSELERLHISTT